MNQNLSKIYINQAIREAEWEFARMDFKKEIEEPLENQGWKLDFIYLDDGTNRFQVTKPDID